MARKKIGQILKAFNLIDDAALDEALKIQQETGHRLGAILVEMGKLSEVHLAKALAKQFNLPFVDLSKGEIPKEVIDAVPQALAQEHRILPVKKKGHTVIVALTDPLDLYALDNLRFILHAEVQCALATPSAMKEALTKYYGAIDLPKDDFQETFESLTQTDIDFREEESDDGADGYDEGSGPIIALVEQMITEAYEQRASDIHVEPMEGRVRVRYRIDGECREVNALKKALQGPVLQRIKIMAKLDIAEKRKPQDGRIQMRFATGTVIDLRVSSLPSSYGESIVLRLLDKEKNLVSLAHLGFSQAIESAFKKTIKRPNGVFLVTGPTGSGKTTTLYASLCELNRPDVKIITAEDPVEYHIDGINQCQVKHQIGLNFARILRAMLRQAPNVILVGEIRDSETAEIAIQAALTGHLVFSTLHTNDSVGALTRLIDMGVKPFLVASSIQGILAQRLVRVLCPECKEAYEPREVELKMVGLKPADIAGRTIYHAGSRKRCRNCNGVGYRGRMGIHELLEMSTELREMTFRKMSAPEIRTRALQTGMLSTLQQDGVRKILDGKTTIEEVLKIIHREDIAQ